MQHELAVDISAPAEAVWGVLADVTAWPQWTPSVAGVEVLDPGALHEGQRVRLRQPRLPTAVWRVTELMPQRSFTWTARSPGVTSVADHRIIPRPDGSVTVELAVRQTGPLAPLVGRLFGGLTRRYLQAEAAGLKRRSEAAGA